ncbi:cupin domain-containing protein [Eubacteriales bacterium OttesenSCG-928-A19]|nr:cupin domain-containing protein [Eubacteriales bacterium OttesenSCG-928-A19]
MDVRLAVAENLKLLRERRRLSLDATAKLTGVSKSMLGQIERAEVNPTISVVWKIAVGLKVSFTSLVEPPQTDAQVRPAGQLQPLVEDDGRYLAYPVFPFDAACGFEQYRIVLEPSACLSAQPHMAGTEEYLLIFSGILRVTVDTQVYTLTDGDGFRFRADVPHRYENAGTETVSLSMLIRYEMT